MAGEVIACFWREMREAGIPCSTRVFQNGVLVPFNRNDHPERPPLRQLLRGLNVPPDLAALGVPAVDGETVSVRLPSMISRSASVSR
jgi:hypothetical protein